MTPSFYFYAMPHGTLLNRIDKMNRIDINILNANLKELFIEYSLSRLYCVQISSGKHSYYVSQETMFKIQELYQNKSSSIVHVIDKLIFEIIEKMRINFTYGDNLDNIDNLDDIFKNLQYIGDIESLVTKDFCEAFDIVGYVIEDKNKSYVFMRV